MAVPSTNMTKSLAVAPDGKKYSLYPDGVLPGSAPGALTMDTPTKTATSITGVVIDGNGSTSYQTRVDGGTPVAGLTKAGLTGETQYSVEWRGQNEVDFGPWTTPVNVTTDAAGSIVDPLVHGDTVNFTATNGGARTVTTYETVIGDSGHIEQTALTSQDQNFGNWSLGKGSSYGSNAADIEIVNDASRGKTWFTKVRPGGGATEYDGAIQLVIPDIPTNTKFRVAYHVKSHVATGATGQWKMWRFTAGGVNTNPRYQFFNWFGGNGKYCSFKNSVGDTINWYAAAPFPSSQDTWIKFILEIDTGDQGQTTGEWHKKWVTSSGVEEMVSGSNEGNWPNIEVYRDSGRISEFYLQNYSGNGLGEVDVWHDDVSVQIGSWSSVEIGNNQTYNSCTVLEDQEIISWVQSGSDADISFRVNEGGLAAGNYWLHVKDDSGTVVDSIAVEIQ